MEGRKQKAREGKWNGGFAPYGYALIDGSLAIAEDEAEVIRLIFDKYINTDMGANGVADYLNTHGYKKKKRQNNTLTAFAPSFIKGVLDNPVYMGKLAYGRRATEKIQGTRNEFHVVKQDEYPIYEGEHDAIISEEDFMLAKTKRERTVLWRPGNGLGDDDTQCTYDFRRSSDIHPGRLQKRLYIPGILSAVCNDLYDLQSL